MQLTYFLLNSDIDSAEKAANSLEPGELDYNSSGYLLSAEGGPHPRNIFVVAGYKESGVPDWLDLIDDHAFEMPRFTSCRYSMVVIVKAVAIAPGEGDEQERTVSRFMAVTAGSGYSYLNPGDVVQTFGKDVVLNWTQDGQLLELETDNPGRRGRRTNQKLHEEGSVNDFAILDELFSVIKVGSKVSNDGTDEAISGGRSARFRGSANLDNLIAICDILLQKFLDERSRPGEFLGFEPTQPVVGFAETEAALEAFFEELLTNDAIDLGFSEPESRDDDKWYALRYKLASGDTQYRHVRITDWRAVEMRTLLRAHLTNPVRQRSAQVVLRSLEQDGREKSWGFAVLTKYVSFISLPSGGQKWIISDGTVYRVPSELHDRLNERVALIARCPITLPHFNRASDYAIVQPNNRRVLSEAAYNARICDESVDQYTNFDVAEFRDNIDRSKVEVCDIFVNGRLICVKRGLETPQIGAVCQQAIDAAICLENYDDYWNFLQGKLRVPFDHSPKRDSRKFTFVLALVTHRRLGSLDELPLKSKLAIARCFRSINGSGFNLEYAIIDDRLQ